MISEYCVTFVTGPDDEEGSDDNVVYHTHVHASDNAAALVMAYLDAAHNNIDLRRTAHVMMATTMDVQQEALATYTQLRQHLRGMHQDGAPLPAPHPLPPSCH